MSHWQSKHWALKAWAENHWVEGTAVIVASTSPGTGNARQLYQVKLLKQLRVEDEELIALLS